MNRFDTDSLLDAIDMVRAYLTDEYGDPRVLTAEELAALPEGAVVWEEFYNGEENRSTAMYAAMKTGVQTLVSAEGVTYICEDMAAPDVDGNRFRWWSAKPTVLRRGHTPWEGGA